MKRKNALAIIVLTIVLIVGIFAIKYYGNSDNDNQRDPIEPYVYELTEEEKLRTNDFVLFRYRDVSFVASMHAKFLDDMVKISYYVYVPDSRYIDETVEDEWYNVSGDPVQVGEIEIAYENIEPIDFFEGEPQLVYINKSVMDYLGLEKFDLHDLAYGAGRGGWYSLRNNDSSKWDRYYLVIYDNYFVLLEKYEKNTSVEELESIRYVQALVCTYDGYCNYGLNPEEYDDGSEKGKYMETLSRTSHMEPYTYYDLKENLFYIIYKLDNGEFMRVYK